MSVVVESFDDGEMAAVRGKMAKGKKQATKGSVKRERRSEGKADDHAAQTRV